MSLELVWKLRVINLSINDLAGQKLLTECEALMGWRVSDEQLEKLRINDLASRWLMIKYLFIIF